MKPLLAALFLIATASAADWPEFLGPNRDNTSPETGLLDGWPATGPRVIWSRPVGTGYSAPSVRDGLLVCHERTGDEEIVQAYDAKTGEPSWAHRYPSKYVDPFGYNNGPRCAPLLTADRCYTFGAEGVLTCLELKTGKLVWQRFTQREWTVPEAFFGVGSCPVIEDGRLYLMLGAQPDSGVIALDPATGKTLWESVGEKTWTGVKMNRWPGEPDVKWNPAHPAFAKQASYCTPVLATVHGRRLLFACMRQGLVGLDAKTGEVLFSYWFRAIQDESVTAMTPVVAGDTVLISSAYYRVGSVLLRVAPDCKSVAPVWMSRALEMHWSRPILHDGHLHGFSGRNEPDADFRCVELATGAIKWQRTEAWPNAFHSKLRDGEKPPEVFGRGAGILADGKHIVLGEAGLLGLFRPRADRLEELARWQVPGLTYPCWAGPVLAERRLYLRGENHLICLDLATGEK